jgi:hypothetical protein
MVAGTEKNHCLTFHSTNQLKVHTHIIVNIDYSWIYIVYSTITSYCNVDGNNRCEKGVDWKIQTWTLSNLVVVLLSSLDCHNIVTSHSNIYVE